MTTFRSLSVLLFSAACWLPTQVAHGKPLDSNVTMCGSIHITYPSLESNFSIEALRNRLRKQVGGCRLVNGDVVIKNFGVDPISQKPLGGNFRMVDTDFLDSIEEIEGQLLIFRVNIDRLIFRNLTVIRGSVMMDRACEKHIAIEIRLMPFPVRLQFPKLTSIKSGIVRLTSIVHPEIYCFLSRRIDWKLLFRNGHRAQYFDGVDHVSPIHNCSTVSACNNECERTPGMSANCWSDGPEGCQSTRHRCLTSRCDPAFCYRDATTSEERCCHPTCLGGCSGGGPEHCDSCSSVSLEGTCDDTCRHEESALLQLESLCVKSCPMPYLVTPPIPICWLRCGDFEIPKKGVCTPCAECNSLCAINTSMLTDSGSETLMKKNCHLWTSSFYSLGVNTVGLKSGKSLKSLEGLRAFYGRLHIKKVDQLGAKGLDFLRNLEFVSDRFSIMSMRVRYIGLARLQYARALGLVSISGLCRAWYPKRHLEKLRQKFFVLERNIAFDDASEECRVAACDRRCGDSECWGPGPEMCVADTD